MKKIHAKPPSRQEEGRSSGAKRQTIEKSRLRRKTLCFFLAAWRDSFLRRRIGVDPLHH